MNKPLLTLPLLCLAVSAVAQMKHKAGETCDCSPAPTAKAGSDYKGPASLTKGKPAILVFLKSGCPSNKDAAKDLNLLAKEVKGKVGFYAFTDSDKGSAAKLKAKLGLTFPVLADPGAKAIKGFGAKHGLDVALLCVDGGVPKVYPGYDRNTFADLSKLIVKHHGPKLNLALAALPTQHKSGCSF